MFEMLFQNEDQLRTSIRNLALVSLALIALICCNPTSNKDPFQSVENTQIRSILEKAINRAGGIDRYSSIQSISYTKRSVLYTESGRIESDISQNHQYQLKPQLSGEIHWTEEGQPARIVYKSGKAHKELADSRIPGSETSAEESFLSAYYTLFIPFKLLDPGTQLSHEGLDTLESGHVVDVIRASYDTGQDANHSTDDIWWYYFDRADGRHLASKVFHAPTYAFIENSRYRDDYPIRVNAHRKSFRVDSSGNKQYLRGEFFYSRFNFE